MSNYNEVRESLFEVHLITGETVFASLMNIRTPERVQFGDPTYYFEYPVIIGNEDENGDYFYTYNRFGSEMCVAINSKNIVSMSYIDPVKGSVQEKFANAYMESYVEAISEMNDNEEDDDE